MVNDATSFVRVRRWYKALTRRNPETKETVTYKFWLDWDIGNVDDGAYYVVGPPSQMFSTDIYGSPMADSRILVTEEKMPLSEIEGAARAVPGDAIHFKWPNI